MTLAAKIIATQQLVAGESVGGTVRASWPMRPCALASWPVATPTAYVRICPTGTPVLIHGVRSRTLGGSSMDMLAVDLGPVPEAGEGSRVTLWGQAAVNGAGVVD